MSLGSSSDLIEMVLKTQGHNHDSRVLEKKELHQEADILENYGIDSETDVSLLDQDGFSELAASSRVSR